MGTHVYTAAIHMGSIYGTGKGGRADKHACPGRQGGQDTGPPAIVKVFQPVMWVYLADGCTVRWRRGDDVAYVFADRQASDGAGTVSAIDTIPVSKNGWTDIVDVRMVATRWRRAKGT